MYKETIIAYHSTKRKNLNSILKNGYNISKSNGHHWLGSGIYFWCDAYYAVEWTIICTDIANYISIPDDMAIFETVLKYDHQKELDLTSPVGLFFIEQMKLKLYSIASTNRIYNTDDKLLIYLLEKNDFLSDFDLIKATYYKDIYHGRYLVKNNSNFIKSPQTQICVKNKNILSNNRLYKDNDNLNFLYSVLQQNRKNNEHNNIII